MKKKRLWLGLGSGVALALLIIGLSLYSIGAPATAPLTAYVQTLHGINHDARATLHKIREGPQADDNVQILHDQFHLMKDTLYLVKKGDQQDPHFRQIHDLNHDMRDAWHEDGLRYLERLAQDPMPGVTQISQEALRLLKTQTKAEV